MTLTVFGDDKPTTPVHREMKRKPRSAWRVTVLFFCGARCADAQTPVHPASDCFRFAGPWFARHATFFSFCGARCAHAKTPVCPKGRKPRLAPLVGDLQAGNGLRRIPNRVPPHATTQDWLILILILTTVVAQRIIVAGPLAIGPRLGLTPRCRCRCTPACASAASCGAVVARARPQPARPRPAPTLLLALREGSI
jgi:hypothetical protein